MAVKKTNTHKRTIEISDDFDPVLEDALIRQLEKGTNVLTVGNLADLQRAGALVVAGGDTEFSKGSGFAAGVALNPNQDEDAAKAGAERVIDEEKAAKAGPEAVDPPKAEGADAVTVVDPTSSSPEPVKGKGRK